MEFEAERLQAETRAEMESERKAAEDQFQEQIASLNAVLDKHKVFARP